MKFSKLISLFGFSLCLADKLVKRDELKSSIASNVKQTLMNGSIDASGVLLGFNSLAQGLVNEMGSCDDALLAVIDQVKQNDVSFSPETEQDLNSVLSSLEDFLIDLKSGNATDSIAQVTNQISSVAGKGDETALSELYQIIITLIGTLSQERNICSGSLKLRVRSHDYNKDGILGDVEKILDDALNGIFVPKSWNIFKNLADLIKSIVFDLTACDGLLADIGAVLSDILRDTGTAVGSVLYTVSSLLANLVNDVLAAVSGWDILGDILKLVGKVLWLLLVSTGELIEAVTTLLSDILGDVATGVATCPSTMSTVTTTTSEVPSSTSESSTASSSISSSSISSQSSISSTVESSSIISSSIISGSRSLSSSELSSSLVLSSATPYSNTTSPDTASSSDSVISSYNTTPLSDSATSTLTITDTLCTETGRLNSVSSMIAKQAETNYIASSIAAGILSNSAVESLRVQISDLTASKPSETATSVATSQTLEQVSYSSESTNTNQQIATFEGSANKLVFTPLIGLLIEGLLIL